MSQNIYDDPDFFAGYSRLGRSTDGLNGAAEWPALRAMLPAVADLCVLDLGCGFGWFCRWVREQGAREVTGIDISERMLNRARGETHDPAIRFMSADLEQLTMPVGPFDLVYSSLAFHYLIDLEGLLTKVARVLVPGGSLVFSVEHPIFTAPSRAGWAVDADGRRTWPVDGYLQEGPRTTDWLTKGVVKQHRTIGTYLNLLLRLGFSISHIEEWGPTDAQIAARPVLAEERQRPPFLLVAARRPVGGASPG